MEAVIPHLRLLTLPLNELDGLSEYLSASEMLFLANTLGFKNKSSSQNICARLNSSTVSRSRPATRREILSKKFVLEFIAEDLLKSDWEMIQGVDVEPRNGSTWKSAQISFVGRQHLLVKGMQILTKANYFPRFELVGNTSDSKSR